MSILWKAHACCMMKFDAECMICWTVCWGAISLWWHTRTQHRRNWVRRNSCPRQQRFPQSTLVWKTSQNLILQRKLTTAALSDLRDGQAVPCTSTCPRRPKHPRVTRTKSPRQPLLRRPVTEMDLFEIQIQYSLPLWVGAEKFPGEILSIVTLTPLMCLLDRSALAYSKP